MSFNLVNSINLSPKQLYNIESICVKKETRMTTCVCLALEVRGQRSTRRPEGERALMSLTLNPCLNLDLALLPSADVFSEGG